MDGGDDEGGYIRHFNIDLSRLRNPVVESRVMPLIEARPNALGTRELHESAPAALGRVVTFVKAPYRGWVQRGEVRFYGLRSRGVG